MKMPGSPVFWDDGSNVHACDGAEHPPGIVLLWTDCGRDVPANGGYTLTEGGLPAREPVTCEKCLAAPEGK